MRITLAYPYEGHAPDETIEVDDDVGRQMVRDGVARLPKGATDDVGPMTPVSTPAPPPDPNPKEARRGRR